MRTSPARPLAPMTRATARRSVVADDLQLDVPSIARAHDAEERADRVGDASVAADDATHVALPHLEGERDLFVAFADLDHDRLGVVDEGARHVLQEGLHSASSAAGAASSPASSSGAAASAAAGSTAASTSGSAA